MSDLMHKVVVTGGTGFLGQHVAAELTDHGYDVAAVGCSDADLRERSEIDRLLGESVPDAVIHLAAVVGGIGANQAQPGRFFYENAVMGIELLEGCRRAGVPKVVIAGTVCSYPKHTPVPFREDALWDGYPEETNAPYGLAKKMLSVQAQAYREQYGCNIISLLPVNLYGPGDSFDLESGHVIPALIRRFLSAREQGQREVTLWGDGRPTREFLYVSDAARGFRCALERYDGSQPVNLGSGEEISIKDLAQVVAEITGYDGAIVWDTSRPNGQPRRMLDTTRARDLFGFDAQVPLREGLTRTVESYTSATMSGISTSL